MNQNSLNQDAINEINRLKQLELEINSFKNRLEIMGQEQLKWEQERRELLDRIKQVKDIATEDSHSRTMLQAQLED